MDAKINFPDLSMLLAKQCNMTAAKAEQFSKAFFDIIIEGLEKDGMVKINGLGTFKVIDVASRGSINVNTGEKIEIKGHRKLTFIPADTLKENINAPFAMFEPVEVTDDYVDDVAESDNSEDSENETLLNEDNPTNGNIEEDASTDKMSVEAEPLPVEEITSDETIPSDFNVTVVAESDCVTDSSQNETIQNIAGDMSEDNNSAVEPESIKRNKMWYIIPALILFIVVGSLFIYNAFFFVHDETESIDTTVIQVEATAKNRQVADNVQVVDTMPIIAEETKKAAEQPFVMIEELANTPLSSITISDTLLYNAVGNLAVHRVGADETLTKIALKYYGDKKLWPYLVKYNDMGNHNQLEIGMELAIPRLVPRK